MDIKNLENIMQIPIVFAPGENVKNFSINAREYDKYIIVNPKVSTFMSWENISEKIGNDKIQLTTGDIYFPTNVDALLNIIGFGYSPIVLDENGNNIAAWEQADLINPTGNCFTERNTLWTKFEYGNFAMNSANFEYLTVNASGLQPPLSTFPRITNRKPLIVNGPIRIINKAPVDVDPGKWTRSFVSVYDGNGNYVSALSETALTLVGADRTFAIPYNSGYSIRITIGFNDNSSISPTDMNAPYLVGCNLFDTSQAAKTITSPPFFLSSMPAQLQTLNNFPVFVTCFAHFYDIVGNFLSTYGTFIFTPPPFNVPNAKYIVYEIFNPNTFVTLSNQLGPDGTTPNNMIIPSQTAVQSQNNITGISYFPGLPAVNKIIKIPDGYYSGLNSTVTPTQSGFMEIVDLINNDVDFISLGGSLAVNSLTYQTAFSGIGYIIRFLKNNKETVINEVDNFESSNRLFGYYNIPEIVVNNNTIISPNSIDLFSDGRFATINILLTSLASYGYKGETTSVISIPAINGYGTLIVETDISYNKLLPKLVTLENLLFQLVDGKNFPISLNETLNFRFEIRCYSK